MVHPKVKDLCHGLAYKILTMQWHSPKTLIEKSKVINYVESIKISISIVIKSIAKSLKFIKSY